MEVLEWIMGGGLLAVVAFAAATYMNVGKIKEETEQRHARFYSRLDEVKQMVESKYASKDVCKILHDQVSRDLSDIKADLKLLLRMNKNNGKSK